MAVGGPNIGRDAEREDVPVFYAENLGNGDVVASSPAMNVRSMFNRALILAALVLSSVNCGKPEIPRVKDFSADRAVDPNETQCRETNPHVIAYDCSLIGSNGRCIPIEDDSRIKQFKIFDDKAMKAIEKLNKLSPEERKRMFDRFRALSRSLLKDRPDLLGDPTETTEK